jgi:hypothetical protein
MALQAVLIVRHQPWLDEWQALQIAVQSPTLADLGLNLRYEGHPPLWYLLLRGLGAVLHNQTLALPVAALLIALPVQATILLAAPFGRVERLALSLSQFVLFEYLTVSRSLTLGFAVMIFVAATWRRKWAPWLLIALLPMCDFLFGVVSVLLVLLRWREGRLSVAQALPWLVCGLLAAWTVRPMPDTVSALTPEGLLRELLLWLGHFSALGLPLQWSGSFFKWNAPPPLILVGPALFGFAAVVRAELSARPDRALALAVFVGFTLVFSLSVYELSVRHLGIAAILLIVLVWIDGPRDRSRWWRGWLIVSALCGLATASIALVEPFDTAPQAAAAIDRMGLHDRTWVSFPRPFGQGVAALDAIAFERLDSHCSEDFIRWNVPGDKRPDPVASVPGRLQRKVDADGQFYLLSNLALPEHPPLLHRIAQIPPGYDGQAFYLYRVGGDHPLARPHGQRCNGPGLPLSHV